MSYSNPVEKPSHYLLSRKEVGRYSQRQLVQAETTYKHPSTVRASFNQDSSKGARQGVFCRKVGGGNYRKSYGSCLALCPASSSSQLHIRGTRDTMH